MAERNAVLATLDQERLRSQLHYDPATGVFTRAQMTGHTVKVGEVAGTKRADGYIVIKIDGVKFHASRLAFLWMTGRWPDRMVDHRNGVRGDNRWDNLREADKAKNTQNSKRYASNTSGIKGVSRHHKKWRASIGVKGRRINLGSFETREAAGEAYRAAAEKHFGDFARTT